MNSFQAQHFFKYTKIHLFFDPDIQAAEKRNGVGILGGRGRLNKGTNLLSYQTCFFKGLYV